MAFGAATARKHVTSDDPWAYNWMKTNSPATGPYMLQKWTPGVEQVLVRNPHWFGPKPDIDKIIYRQVPSDSNRLALLLNGSAQIARDLTQDELDNVSKSSDKGVTATCIAANQFVYVALNFASGPTSKLAVRQALAYAVPYDNINSSVYHGRAKRLYGMVTGNYVDYLGDSDSVTFEEGPIRKIAAEGQLMGYRHEGFWQPMDTYQEFMLLNRLWKEGKAPWKTW